MLLHAYIFWGAKLNSYQSHTRTVVLIGGKH